MSREVTLDSAATSRPAPPGRWTAWLVTWVAYATYYTGRKGLSVVKTTLEAELGVGAAALGVIDSVFLTSYALGQFGSGWLGDRIGARRLVGLGLLASAVACAAFGSSSGALAFGIAFAANGLAQSTGWPGTTRSMAEWTTKETRGTVMALWATCYQVGGIVATPLAGWLLARHGWRSAFFGPAVLMSLVGLLVLALLRPGPGASTAEAASTDDAAARRAEQRAVLRSPLLWSYAASYFCIKFIRYALLFWLPYYLSKKLGYAKDQAAYVSTAFEIGGIVGVIAIGVLSDRLRKISRAAFAAGCLLLLALALVSFTGIGQQSQTSGAVGLALVGAALFGPDSLISGAASQDVGGARSAATATGFVNGIGSIGAIAEGLVVPWVSAKWGWSAVFGSFVALAVLSSVLLLPAVVRGRAED